MRHIEMEEEKEDVTLPPRDEDWTQLTPSTWRELLRDADEVWIRWFLLESGGNGEGRVRLYFGTFGDAGFSHHFYFPELGCAHEIRDPSEVGPLDAEHWMKSAAEDGEDGEDRDDGEDGEDDEDGDDGEDDEKGRVWRVTTTMVPPAGQFLSERVQLFARQRPYLLK